MIRPGPGALVTAAFIGPGTVTTASLAGAQTGLGLVPLVLFALIATIALQEMAMRFGIVGRTNIRSALLQTISLPGIRTAIIALIVLGIGVGNTAYQSGNLLGAVIGAQLITGLSETTLTLSLGLIAFALLRTGSYKLIETLLVLLVATMSIVFLMVVAIQATAIVDQLPTLTFLFQPANYTGGHLTLMLALIGTTIVPYNLFLHAGAVQERWPVSDKTETNLIEARRELITSVSIGGVITLCILMSSSLAFFGSETAVTGRNIPAQMEPLLGSYGKYLFATGILAAGLTSAITAPLAAAWALTGALGWSSNMTSTGFRAIWMLVLITGVGFAALQTKPLAAILFAQFANGLMLPVFALGLLWLCNQTAIMKQHRNSSAVNQLGWVILLVCFVLGSVKMSSFFASIIT